MNGIPPLARLDVESVMNALMQTAAQSNQTGAEASGLMYVLEVQSKTVAGVEGFLEELERILVPLLAELPGVPDNVRDALTKGPPPSLVPAIRSIEANTARIEALADKLRRIAGRLHI